MRDLQTRLREFAAEAKSIVTGDRTTAMMAADEIDRLRAALEDIVRESNGVNKGAAVQKIAIETLAHTLADAVQAYEKARYPELFPDCVPKRST